jgi:hypothetical protein
VLEVAAARGRQPVELHRENQDQHDPEPERRHRLPEQRDHRRDVVEHAVALDGRDDPGRDGQAERDEQRGSGQLEGGGHALDDQVERRLAVAHGLSEIAAQRAGEEAAVLDDERIIEAHRLAELPDVLFGRIGRQQHQRWIAGEIQDEEHDEGDAEQDQQRLGQPPREEDLHGARRRRATASMCGVCGNMSTGSTHSSRYP